MDTLKSNVGIRFVDLKTLSEIKSISVFTLRKYCKDEDLPHQRVGRKIIVDPLQFDEWFLRKNSSITKKKNVGELLQEVWDEIM